VFNVASVPVRHDIGNTSLGGRLDKLAVGVAGRSGGYCDDEELLALEGGDNSGLVGIVNWGDEDALGEFVAAIFAGQGRNRVFSGFKESGDDVGSNSASGLRAFVSCCACGACGAAGGIHLHRQWRLSQRRF
jgi:hypothetical protein